VFTGLIQSVGMVAGLEKGELLLKLKMTDWEGDPFEIGESIAVNGCCLTITRLEGDGVYMFTAYDLSEETMKRTDLGDLESGDMVNIERAMSSKSRFGGHIVQGHVDGIGHVMEIDKQELSTRFRFELPYENERFLIEKGSITLDGISLTVCEPSNGQFDVWVIPHTLMNTNLGKRIAGDSVNFEIDVMAKYADKLLEAYKR